MQVRAMRLLKTAESVPVSLMTAAGGRREHLTRHSDVDPTPPMDRCISICENRPSPCAYLCITVMLHSHRAMVLQFTTEDGMAATGVARKFLGAASTPHRRCHSCVLVKRCAWRMATGKNRVWRKAVACRAAHARGAAGNGLARARQSSGTRNGQCTFWFNSMCRCGGREQQWAQRGHGRQD